MGDIYPRGNQAGDPSKEEISSRRLDGSLATLCDKLCTSYWLGENPLLLLARLPWDIFALLALKLGVDADLVFA
jgi:hypothetical protein